MPYGSHSITLPSDLFSLALHPSRPLLAAGLSSGHLHTYTWPYSEGSDDDHEDDDDDDGDDVEGNAKKEEDGVFKIAWKTMRHKGSCRCVAFSADGDVIYSSGTDSLFKAASSETGRVFAKTYIPGTSSGKLDSPTTILSLSAHHLLIGADSGTIHLFDTRTPTLSNPSSSWKAAHDDYVSSLTALPPSAATTTGFSRQFISTGDTTLAHLDVRKPGALLFKSEDQEDELLCSAFISGLPQKGGRGGEKIITGNTSGVVTLWNKGEWADHENRINVSKASGDSVDAVVVLPESFTVEGKWGRYVATGSGDGKVRIVKMGSNGVVATLAHSLTAEEVKMKAIDDDVKGGYDRAIEEGVAALGIDCEGRVVSGGGNVVRAWYWDNTVKEVDEENKKKRRNDGSDSDEDGNGSEEDDSSEDEREKRRKKKKKKGKGKARSVAVKAVASFKGLD